MIHRRHPVLWLCSISLACCTHGCWHFVQDSDTIQGWFNKFKKSFHWP